MSAAPRREIAPGIGGATIAPRSIPGLLDEADALSIPPIIRWIGPGATVFAGPAGEHDAGGLREIGSMADLRRAFGEGGDRPFRSALAAYFAARGGPAAVLNLPALAVLPAAARAASWLGDDGPPGRRTGLRSLLDREELGTLAFPGLADPEIRERIAAGLQSSPLFLIFDGPQDGSGGGSGGGPGGGEERLPAVERLALVGGWTAGADGAPVPPTGPALARIERSDFREDDPFPALRALESGGHPTASGTPQASVEEWRLREGLRRSIDRGTRWVVFEANSELLRRRVEREVTAFLSRLHRHGLLKGRTPGEAFRVRCASRPAPGEGAAESCLVLRVEVRWKDRRRDGPAPPPEGAEA